MTLKEKAEARRTRLRTKVETRTPRTRIEASIPREDRVVDTFMRIGKVSITTEKRPTLTHRGVNIARKPVRASITDVRAREEVNTRTPRRRARTP